MRLNIVIVGAGLGGLAAALYLHRDGHNVAVYEQATSLGELGAGIVVPPNLVRPLQRLGLLQALQRRSVRLEAAWEFRRWQNGQVLFSQPMGDHCEQLYGAACYVAHRADLLDILRQSLPATVIRTGHCFRAARPMRDCVSLNFATATGQRWLQADLAIGADGIHSAVRSLVVDTLEPRFSGLCAFRCLVAADRAPAFARRPVQTLWLGPGRHFVHYPVRAGQLINIVAIGPARDWRDESWTATGEVADLAREYAGWDPRLGQLIDAAEATTRWALYDREPLDSWCKGRIGLLGDAAHAMLPLYAQGAAQAIEDAEALAICLRGIDSAAVVAALQRYQQRRKTRADRVLLMSRGRERRNHLPDGPAQIERDAQLRQADPLRDSSWLYGREHEAA